LLACGEEVGAAGYGGAVSSNSIWGEMAVAELRYQVFIFSHNINILDDFLELIWGRSRYQLATAY
jgi:hypothetical protein